MTTENRLNKIETTQEFVDAMGAHHESINSSLGDLPPEIADRVIQARQLTNQALSLTPDKLVVIFGEQAYGLNERSKVLGKRLYAKGLEKHGAQSIELFASYDSVGSEPSIYRMQLPHTQSRDGYMSLNVLSGWKKHKNTITHALRSPTPDEMDAMVGRLSGSYRQPRAVSLTRFMGRYYQNHPISYAKANIAMLREFEKQIGLGVDTYVTEDVLDSAIARNGGMEFMLYFWPILIGAAERHKTDGVRIPQPNETPFFLYHEDGECNGRMIGQFEKNTDGLHMDTNINCLCLQCRHTDTTSPKDIIEKDNNITWRAIPRVVLYSTVGVADGHITGGGSQYDITAAAAMKELGTPFFPITWMKRRGKNGEKENPFVYESYVTTRGGIKTHKYLPHAKSFVKEGRSAMADLALSVGVDNLRTAIEEQVENGISRSTKVNLENNQEDNNPIIFK